MNFADFEKKLAAESAKIKTAAAEGVGDFADDILAKAQERAPVVTGELRDSGRVVRGEDGARVEFAAEHAARVHENPESDGYRFLESTVQDEAKAMPEAVAGATKKRWK